MFLVVTMWTLWKVSSWPHSGCQNVLTRLGSSKSDSFCLRLPVFATLVGSSFIEMSGGTWKGTPKIRLVWVQYASELRVKNYLWRLVSFGIYTFWMGPNYHGSARGSKEGHNHALIMIYQWLGLITANCGFTSYVWIKGVIRPSRPFSHVDLLDNPVVQVLCGVSLYIKNNECEDKKLNFED